MNCPQEDGDCYWSQSEGALLDGPAEAGLAPWSSCRFSTIRFISRLRSLRDFFGHAVTKTINHACASERVSNALPRAASSSSLLAVNTSRARLARRYGQAWTSSPSSSKSVLMSHFTTAASAIRSRSWTVSGSLYFLTMPPVAATNSDIASISRPSRALFRCCRLVKRTTNRATNPPISAATKEPTAPLIRSGQVTVFVPMRRVYRSFRNGVV